MSAFWRTYGGNPILHHHALPAGHAPPDAARLPPEPRRSLGLRPPLRHASRRSWWRRCWRPASPAPGSAGWVAAAVVLVNLLVWRHQVFGANDIRGGGTCCQLSPAPKAAARQGAARVVGRASGLGLRDLAASRPAVRAVPARPSPGRARLRATSGAATPEARFARPIAAAASVFALVVPCWRSRAVVPARSGGHQSRTINRPARRRVAQRTRWAARPASASRTSRRSSTRRCAVALAGRIAVSFAGFPPPPLAGPGSPDVAPADALKAYRVMSALVLAASRSALLYFARRPTRTTPCWPRSCCRSGA